LRLVQAPTTVVAQVDSSIGGKVGVDLPEGKNLVGAFKHPELVLIDYATLRTLPEAEWVAGTAEAVKHGVIADAALFTAFEADPQGWRGRSVDPAPLLDAAVRVKARVVQEDEKELGMRMILNYGHTLGHALEAAAAYRGLRHGEAVAWGMAMEARLAVGMGLSTPGFVARQDRLLLALGLLRPLPALDAAQVYGRMFLDKKVRHGQLRWILPGATPGSVTIRDDAPELLARDLVTATVEGTLLK
jgi:3-dehydroquinate synthase